MPRGRGRKGGSSRGAAPTTRVTRSVEVVPTSNEGEDDHSPAETSTTSTTQPAFSVEQQAWLSQFIASHVAVTNNQETTPTAQSVTTPNYGNVGE